MRLALYHPTHGYYFDLRPDARLPVEPQRPPVFGAAIARQLADFWRLLDRPARFDVFEAGAGSGRLAADVLRALRTSRAGPLRRTTLCRAGRDAGRAATARAPRARRPARRARSTSRRAAGVAARSRAASSATSCWTPCRFDRVRRRDGQLYELRVGVGGRPPRRRRGGAAAGRSSGYFAALGLLPAEGCEAEVNLAAPAWTTARRRRAAPRLPADPGLRLRGAEQLYAPWRKRGTLLTFYRHTSGDDPYARIGRQDITASVDFTSVCARRRGGRPDDARPHDARRVPRRRWASAKRWRARRAPDELEAYYALRRAVMELTDRAGLGRIRVLVQGKGPIALRRVDRPC